jgi:hypothetical protein
MNDKIKDILSFAYKDLIDKAYKTDSIAKNKWRIENREQLREQRKKELKELMEKDKTMSNNKQSSVDWLVKELNQKIDFIPMNKWDEIKEVIDQAKAMHKEEIEDAWDKGDYCIDLPDGTWEQKYKSAEQYYNETFGGNSDQR